MNLPHWSLSNIYPSVDSAEFMEDLAKVKELSSLLEKDCFRGATISSLILPKIDESPIVYPDYPFDSSICVDYPMEIHFDGTKEEFKTLYKNLFQGFKWNTIHVFYTDGDSFFEDIV